MPQACSTCLICWMLLRASNMPFRLPSWIEIGLPPREQRIDCIHQLAQVADLVDSITQRHILRHIAIAGTPLARVLGIEPDHLASAALDLLKVAQIRVV